MYSYLSHTSVTVSLLSLFRQLTAARYSSTYIKTKENFSQASQATIENCLPRYELAAKKASKISDFDWPSATLLQKRNALMQDDLLKSDVDFVVSDTLITPGAGYNALHHWLCRTIPPDKFIFCKFKLSKISRKIYEKNSGMKVDNSHIFLTFSSTSTKKRKRPRRISTTISDLIMSICQRKIYYLPNQISPLVGQIFPR